MKTLSIDLSEKQNTPVVYAVQGEKNSRKIRFDLFQNGMAYEIDQTSSVLISYKKPDGHGGMYDVLDNLNPAFEFAEDSTNSVIITLAEQVLTTIGQVPLVVSFMLAGEVLSTFNIVVDVSENPGIDVAESVDYFSLLIAIETAKQVAGDMFDPTKIATIEYVDNQISYIEENINEVEKKAKIFYVKITENDGTFSSDKSVPVIKSAYNSGRTVKALVIDNQKEVSVPLIGIIEGDTAFYAGYGINGYYLIISQTDIKISLSSKEVITQEHLDKLTDGITPHIGENGNWFIGDTDTGMPSRGEDGAAGEVGPQGEKGDTGPQGPQGDPGEKGEAGPSGIHVGTEAPEDETVHVWIDPDAAADELPVGVSGGYYTPSITQPEAGKVQFDWTASQSDMPAVPAQSVVLPAGEKGDPGKSAYQYAQDGGYTGTEEEFAEKLAADVPTGGGSDYTLPVATPDTLGGVKPAAKTEDMTQSVGVDESGGLWTVPGGGNGTSDSKWRILDTIDLAAGAVSYEIDATGCNTIKIINISALDCTAPYVGWHGIDPRLGMVKVVGNVMTMDYIGNGIIAYQNGRSDTLQMSGVSTTAKDDNNTVILAFASVVSGTIVIAGR